MKPPPEFGAGVLWKLNKAIYGLTDASREWYLKVCEAMTEMRACRSQVDNAVFYWHRNDSLVAMCGVHVDDFINTGMERDLNELTTNIK